MSLHDEMINIRCDEAHLSEYPDLRTHYKSGHCDARHAAAELALKADTEINRLMALIEEHNSQMVCDKERCGYAGYKRDCPDCPKQWIIDVSREDL